MMRLTFATKNPGTDMLIALNAAAISGRRHIYAGTVPADEVAARRRRNRAARKARRATRLAA